LSDDTKKEEKIMREENKYKMNKQKKDQDDGSFSDDGDDVFFVGGDLDEECITSDSLPRDGDDEERSPSTCILSSRSP